MNLFQSIKTCFRKYADLSGRASRSEFWWFVCFTILINLIFDIIDLHVFTIFSDEDNLKTIDEFSLKYAGFSNGLFATIASLLFLTPTASVTSRRLHDIDLSGWWQVFIYTALYSIGLNNLSSINAPYAQLIYWIGLGLTFSAFILVGRICSKGSASSNRFGSPP